ncbi:hypothetical protein LINGRAHAP2_LOCUS15950 [Linum grandiflorum]
MPNYFTTVATSTAATKVVLPDGKVHEFHEPLTAAELMLEHPQQVVVEFDSELMTMTTTTAGRGRKKAVPLSADKKLDANKVYLMLPVKRGKPLSLSSEEARRVVLSANMALKASSSSVKFMPVFAKMCTANSTEGHYEGILVKLVTRKKESVDKSCEEMKVKKNVEDGKKRLLSFFEEEDEEEEMLLENKLASGPEYLSRQLSGKGWRPSLDTIKEKKIEQQKLQHWLF